MSVIPAHLSTENLSQEERARIIQFDRCYDDLLIELRQTCKDPVNSPLPGDRELDIAVCRAFTDVWGISTAAIRIWMPLFLAPGVASYFSGCDRMALRIGNQFLSSSGNLHFDAYRDHLFEGSTGAMANTLLERNPGGDLHLATDIIIPVVAFSILWDHNEVANRLRAIIAQKDYGILFGATAALGMQEVDRLIRL